MGSLLKSIFCGDSERQRGANHSEKEYEILEISRFFKESENFIVVEALWIFKSFLHFSTLSRGFHFVKNFEISRSFFENFLKHLICLKVSKV